MRTKMVKKAAHLAHAVQAVTYGLRTIGQAIRSRWNRTELTKPQGIIETTLNKINPSGTALNTYRNIKSVPVGAIQGVKAVSAQVADDAARAINVPGKVHGVANAARSVGARSLARNLDRTAVRLRQGGERGMANLKKGYDGTSVTTAGRDMADEVGTAIGGPVGGILTGGLAYGKHLVTHPISSIATLGANIATGLPVGSMLQAAKAYTPVLLGGGLRRPLNVAKYGV